MPSSDDPSLIVNPGGGRAPASTVPAGALIPPGGGGGGGGGPILATDVNYSGDGNWVDGTPNPGTNVDAQLTKIIGDLTNDSGDPNTDQHSGADRVSARTTVAEFIDSSTIDGTSIQALIEAFVTALTNDSASTTDHHSGADRVSARQTVATFADGSVVNGSSIQGLTEAILTALASTTVSYAGSDKVAARTTVAEFANNNTATGASIQALVENVITQLGLNVAASGTTATLTVNSSLDIVMVAGLSGLTSDLNNQYITISGSSHSANNGQFQLTYVNSVSVTIPYNDAFVTDAGPLTWSVTPNTAAGNRLIGAGATTSNFADGYPALGTSSHGLADNIVSLLAQDNRTSGGGAVVTANETGGGVSASITVSLGVVTVSGLGGGTINSLLIGQQIVISNASHGGNNGTFTITGLGAVLPASSVTISNGGAATDGNNGNIVWSVSPVILTGLAGLSPTSVGRWVILYGSVIPQNNGSFQVTAFQDSTSVYINNPNALTDVSSLFYSMDTSGKARLGSSLIAPRFADGVTQALVSPGTSLSNVLDNLVYLLSNSLGSSGNTGSLTISTTGGTLSGTFGVVNGSTTVTTTADQTFLFFPAGIIFAAQSTVLYAVTAFTWNGSTGTITLATAYTGTTNTATTAHIGILTFSGLTGMQRNFVGQQIIIQNVTAPNSFVGIIASYINSTSVTLSPTGANITDPLNTVIAWYLYASAAAGANLIGAAPTIATWANGQNFSPGPPNSLAGTFGVTTGLTTVSTTANQETVLFAGSNILFDAVPLVVYTVASVSSGGITLTSPFQGETNGAINASLILFSVQQGFESLVNSLGGTNGSSGAFLVGAEQVGASVPQYSLAQGSVGTQLSSLVRQLNNQFNVRAIGTTWTLTSTWTSVQHHTTGVSTSATFSSANTAGNILTATLFYHAASLPSMTISDTAQNTWVLASNEFNVTAGYGLAVYYCLSANASASNTVSFSGISPATDRNCVQVSEFASGNGIGSINSALYVDQSTGTSTTTGLTVLVNSNNGLTFAAVNLNQSTTGTVGAGLTQLSNHVSSGAGDVSIITATPTGPPLGVFEPGINNAIFVSGTSISWASVGIVFISTPTLDADGTVNEYLSFNLPTPFQLTPAAQNTGRRIYITQGLAFPNDGVVLLPFGIETINGLAAPYTLPTADGHYMLQCDGTGWQVFSC